MASPFDDLIPSQGSAPPSAFGDLIPSAPPGAFDDLTPGKTAASSPGSFGAAVAGLGEGYTGALGDWAKSVQAIYGVKPQDQAAKDQTGMRSPFEFALPDSGTLPKLVYHMTEGLARNVPALGAFVAGSLVGGGPEEPVGITTGALAAGATSAFQSFGPYWADALKQTPNDPSGAWDMALKKAALDGAISTASFKLFSLAPFKNNVMNLAFQTLGVQPAIGAAGQEAQGLLTGQAPTPAELAQGYVGSALSTAIPFAGHKVLSMLRPAGAGAGVPVAEGAPEVPQSTPQAPAPAAGVPSPDLAPGAVVSIRGPDGLPQRAQIQRVGDGLVHWIGEDGTPRVDDAAAFQRDVTAAPAAIMPEPPARPAGEPPITQPDQFVQQFRNGPIEPDVPLSAEKQLPLPVPKAGAEVPPAPVPDSLYVQRPVLNAQELHDWAVKQGIPNVVPAEDMHVTQVYSRTPADIRPLAEPVTATAAEKGVAPLGDEGAVVLHLDSPELQARFGEAKDAGASHDYPEFQPHVTLSYSAPDADLKAAGTPPFPIQLGAETHAPIDENAGARNQAAAPAETPDAMRADLASAGAPDAATIKDADLPERWAQLQSVSRESAGVGADVQPGNQKNVGTTEELRGTAVAGESAAPAIAAREALPGLANAGAQGAGLSSLPVGLHEGLAPNARINAGAEVQGQLPVLRSRLPQEGQAGAPTVPSVRQPEIGDASRRLQPAVDRGLVVPEVPSGSAQAGETGKISAAGTPSKSVATPTEAVIPGLSGEKTVADPGAVATGIKQAAKSFGDMLLDDNGSVPRREKTLTDAERIAAEVKASQPDSLRSISGIAQHTGLAQTIAETDPLGARYLDARQNRNAARHAYQADAQAAGSAWLRLPEARQKAVDKVLEYQTMTGREVQDTGRPVVVHYDAARDFPGRPNPLQIIKDGETVRLSATESKMVHDMNGFFDRAWKQSAQADATKFGYTGPFLKEGAGGRLDFDKAAIQSAIDNAVDKGARLAAERAMGFATTAEQSGRQGYFPLMRYGDWTIAVTPKVPKNPEGYPLRDEGWFAKVDSKDPFASLKGQVVGEDLTKTPKRVAQEMARLKQRFPDADYHMEAKRQAPKTADTVDLAMVSRVLSDSKLTDPETGKRLADDVIAKLYDEAKAGYKHPREGIPGYSTDFARAYSDYARQWSSVTASKLHGNTVQDAFDATQVGPDRRAAKYWDAYHQHNEKPQPWIYGAMKRVGFFNYLWGSPSSAMIQLTQTPLITGTQLGLLVGHTRAQYMANTLAARALSAVRTGRSGLSIDVKDVPGVTARERTALAQADREGRLNPVLPTDFAGGQFSPEMRRRFAPAVRVYDIGASMFNTADRANRIASWLSAYRAAQLPGMAAKAARIYRNDALYREQVGPQMDPAKYANWFTNETQFLSGREGSSPLMRGPGSVLFQFQHYNTNMLRLMRKNLVKMGPEGKAAFGVMLTGLVLGAGVGGLPFVNDAERLANQVGKWVNDGVDPRLDARVHEMIADSGFAQMAAAYFGTDPLHVAEFAMEGGSRSVLGLDLGRRIGLGNILPSNTDLFTAVPFLDATVGKAMEASARYRSGQPEGAVAALLPAALANPYKGYVSWPGEGINPQSGSTPYFLPSQVTPGMQAARALGFQPAAVARRQEFMSDQNAIKFATDQPQKDAANALAGIFARQADAQQKGDTASAAYYMAQGNKLIQQYGAALADPNTPAWEKVALPTRTALTNRIKLYLSQPGTLNIQRADKLKRQEMLNSPYLSQ